MNKPTTQGTIMELSKASQWLVKAKKATDGVSPLGDKVAQILDCIWGIHNVPLAKSVPTQWNDNYVIEIVLDTCSLSTIDDSRLTYLVVLCHDEMLRMSISARFKNRIELMFHQRTQRTGDFSRRCPTIEDHIKAIRVHSSLGDDK